MTEKLDGLQLNNRNRLKDLFLKLSPSRDGSISLSELTKFLKNVKIYPVKIIKDLISAPEFNKLLKRINTTSSISYTKFELILKMIAESSFNPLAPTLERIKMFIIHIRNYVKMHYQISLSINPVKKLLLETQEIQKEYKSTSPARQKKNPYKSLSRTNSIAKNTIPEEKINNFLISSKKIIQRKDSPVIPHIQLLLTQKISKLSSLNSTQSNEIASDRRKHLRSSSSTVASSKNIHKLIQQSFENFKQKHQNFFNKTQNRTGLVKKHDKFIGSLRQSLFSAGFIKSLIFNAWKGSLTKKFDI